MKKFKKLTAFVSALTLAVCAVPMATNAESKEHILTDGTVVHSGDEFLSYKEAYINDTSSDLGDVNRDGCINNDDAYMILKYSVKLAADKYDEYTEEEHEIFNKYGDVFNDGYVNAIDASWVLAKCSANAEILNGDLNQDGIIDISDIDIMRKYDPEYSTDEEYEIMNNYGDMDGDGVSATTIDLALLANLVVGNPEENTEMGDVNHDGFVNAIDASIVACYYAACSCNMYDLYAEAEHENFQTYGDLNNDGHVDSADSSLILMIYAENSTL